MKREIIVLLIFLDSLMRDSPKLESIIFKNNVPKLNFSEKHWKLEGWNRIIRTWIVEVCRRIRRQYDFRTISAINRGRLRPSSCWSRIALNFPRDLHEYRLDAVWRQQTPMETVIIVSQIFESIPVLLSVKLLDHPRVKLHGYDKDCDFFLFSISIFFFMISFKQNQTKSLIERKCKWNHVFLMHNIDIFFLEEILNYL